MTWLGRVRCSPSSAECSKLNAPRASLPACLPHAKFSAAARSATDGDGTLDPRPVDPFLSSPLTRRRPHTMSHITIDLGRGMNKEASGSAGAAAPRLPFLRRRKGLVLIILASLTLLVFVNRSHLSGAQSSIRWVKDSMRPVAAADDAALHTATPAAPLPNDFGVGIAQGALAENGVAGSGTDAFRKLAAEQGYNPEEIEKLAAANVGAIEGGSKPTSAEHLLLFFQALSNPSYTVSSWERTWKSQLMPGSEKAFAKTLAQVSGQADVTMVSTQCVWHATSADSLTLTLFPATSTKPIAANGTRSTAPRTR